MLTKPPLKECPETQDVAWFRGFLSLTCGACNMRMDIPASSLRTIDSLEDGQWKTLYVVHCPWCRGTNVVDEDIIPRCKPEVIFSQLGDNNSNNSNNNMAVGNPFRPFVADEGQYSLFSTSVSSSTGNIFSNPTQVAANNPKDNFESGKKYKASTGNNILLR
jgi:hypothetical protein